MWRRGIQAAGRGATAAAASGATLRKLPISPGLGARCSSGGATSSGPASPKALVAELAKSCPQALQDALHDLPPEVRSRLATELVKGVKEVKAFVGSLEDTEVRALGIAAMSRHFGKDFAQEFEAMDEDRSGKLSRKEFKRYLTHVIPAHHHADADRPSSRQLILFAVNSAIPFVVFGSLDNSIMLLGGDVVDEMIGSFMKLSTLACAALANTFADVLGISIGNTVEALTKKLGLPEAGLTAAQAEMPAVRRVGQVSASLGILCGCLIGMTPLLFMDQDRKAAKSAWEAVDTTNAGVLEVAKLKKVLSKIGVFDVEPDRLAAVLSELGIGRDGKVTQQEFLDRAGRLKDMLSDE